MKLGQIVGLNSIQKESAPVITENCAKAIPVLDRILKDIESLEPYIASAIKEILASQKLQTSTKFDMPSQLQNKHNDSYNDILAIKRMITYLAKQQGEIK